MPPNFSMDASYAAHSASRSGALPSRMWTLAGSMSTWPRKFVHLPGASVTIGRPAKVSRNSSRPRDAVVHMKLW